MSIAAYKEKLRQLYLEEQAKCGLRVGDYARVASAPFLDSSGWQGGWDSIRNQAVGGVYPVHEIDGRGVTLDLGGFTYSFPFYVLEKVEQPEKEKSYAERQSECGLKVGDWVRVTRKAENGEAGWDGDWYAVKDNSVGKVYRIEGLKYNGIVLRIFDDPREYLFPYFVLEKVEQPSEKTDALSPHHYSRWKIQPWDFIAQNKLDFLTGNVIKYVMRHDEKNGLEDLQKARVYLDKLIEEAEKDE